MLTVCKEKIDHLRMCPIYVYIETGYLHKSGLVAETAIFLFLGKITSSQSDHLHVSSRRTVRKSLLCPTENDFGSRNDASVY
jgi:hypothetical protein